MFNMNTRSVTFNIIIINVAFFFGANIFGDKMYEWCALFYPASPLFKPLQVITHMFMHGSLTHIFSNMLALFMFGAVLERVWGPKRFLLFYFITGIGAMILHTAVQAYIVHNFTGSVFPDLSLVMNNSELTSIYRTPTVGASGAIFGILVAFGMLFPNTELMLLFFPYPIKAKYFVTLYVVWELYRGLAMDANDNVAHFAHLGGALFGFILVKIWNRDRNYLY